MTNPNVSDGYSDVYGGSRYTARVKDALSELGYPSAAQLRYMFDRLANCKCEHNPNEVDDEERES